MPFQVENNILAVHQQRQKRQIDNMQINQMALLTGILAIAGTAACDEPGTTAGGTATPSAIASSHRVNEADIRKVISLLDAPVSRWEKVCGKPDQGTTIRSVKDKSSWTTKVFHLGELDVDVDPNKAGLCTVIRFWARNDDSEPLTLEEAKAIVPYFLSLPMRTETEYDGTIDHQWGSIEDPINADFGGDQNEDTLEIWFMPRSQDSTATKTIEEMRKMHPGKGGFQ